jgi:hypothetical protein
LTLPTIDQYFESLSAVSPKPAPGDPVALDLCVRATQAVAVLPQIDQHSLTGVVESDPDLLPVFAAAVGLSQEQFRGWLKEFFDTAGWKTLGRTRPAEVVAAMDRDFGLVEQLGLQAGRKWTWADVLARVMAPKQRAGSAIRHGRALEDAVEAVIEKLGVDFRARTRFEGQGGSTAPADFAIPAGGSVAQIAVAVKGFDSTGSKLGDARREIEEMAKVRRPNQYIFAIVDGRGWHRRANDLRAIYGLWANNEIDGLYSRRSLGDFETALRLAVRRLGLSSPA